MIRMPRSHLAKRVKDEWRVSQGPVFHNYWRHVVFVVSFPFRFFPFGISGSNCQQKQKVLACEAEGGKKETQGSKKKQTISCSPTGIPRLPGPTVLKFDFVLVPNCITGYGGELVE